MTRKKLKAKITIGCGALAVLAAVCIGVAVSWYAALVVEDYSRFTTGMSAGIETSVQRFVYGKALYYGWAAMSVLFIQGGIMCCSSWGDDGAEYIDAHDPYAYSSGYNTKPQPINNSFNARPNNEYI